MFVDVYFQCLQFYRVSALYGMQRPILVASITKPRPKSEKILRKYGRRNPAFLGTRLGQIFSIVYIWHSHDHFEHETYEHSVLRETHVGLNLSDTSHFLSRVDARHQQICRKSQVFRALQHRLSCSLFKTQLKILKTQPKFFKHAGQVGYLKDSLGFLNTPMQPVLKCSRNLGFSADPSPP